MGWESNINRINAPNNTSCMLHQQNKCQYLLVVRLFRINKCLLLLFIIGKICSKFCFFCSCCFVSVLFNVVIGTYCIEYWCYWLSSFHNTLCHFEFVFTVLWFWTLCIKLFGLDNMCCLCNALSLSFTLQCALYTVQRTFNRSLLIDPWPNRRIIVTERLLFSIRRLKWTCIRCALYVHVM